MKIKDRAKPKIPPVPPGVYFAVCVGVIDLGEQYNEKFKKYSNQVQIIWELSGQTVEVDGEQKPRQLSRVFTVATKQNSNLRKFLSSWNGIQYTDEQFAELELFDQIGRGCQLNVILNDTGEYANIDSIMQIPQGFDAPQTTTPPIKWDMDQWDDAVFETLPEWIQGKIKQSTQYQKEHPPAGSIDFPNGQTAANGGAAPAANPAPVAAPVAAPAPSGTITPAAAQNATAANGAPNSAPAANGAAAASPIDFAAYAQPGTAAPAAQPQIVNQGGSVPF